MCVCLKVMQSAPSVYLSVCPCVGLFLFYCLNRVTFDLAFCMCTGHEHSSPGIECQGSRLRSIGTTFTTLNETNSGFCEYCHIVIANMTPRSMIIIAWPVLIAVSGYSRKWMRKLIDSIIRQTACTMFTHERKRVSVIGTPSAPRLALTMIPAVKETLPPMERTGPTFESARGFDAPSVGDTLI